MYQNLTRQNTKNSQTSRSNGPSSHRAPTEGSESNFGQITLHNYHDSNQRIMNGRTQSISHMANQSSQVSSTASLRRQNDNYIDTSIQSGGRDSNRLVDKMKELRNKYFSGQKSLGEGPMGPMQVINRVEADEDGLQNNYNNWKPLSNDPLESRKFMQLSDIANRRSSLNFQPTSGSTVNAGAQHPYQQNFRNENIMIHTKQYDQLPSGANTLRDHQYQQQQLPQQQQQQQQYSQPIASNRSQESSRNHYPNERSQQPQSSYDNYGSRSRSLPPGNFKEGQIRPNLSNKIQFPGKGPMKIQSHREIQTHRDTHSSENENNNFGKMLTDRSHNRKQSMGGAQEEDDLFKPIMSQNSYTLGPATTGQSLQKPTLPTQSSSIRDSARNNNGNGVYAANYDTFKAPQQQSHLETSNSIDTFNNGLMVKPPANVNQNKFALLQTPSIGNGTNGLNTENNQYNQQVSTSNVNNRYDAPRLTTQDQFKYTEISAGENFGMTTDRFPTSRGVSGYDNFQYNPTGETSRMQTNNTSGNFKQPSIPPQYNYTKPFEINPVMGAPTDDSKFSFCLPSDSSMQINQTQNNESQPDIQINKATQKLYPILNKSNADKLKSSFNQWKDHALDAPSNNEDDHYIQKPVNRIIVPDLNRLSKTNPNLAFLNTTYHDSSFSQPSFDNRTQTLTAQIQPSQSLLTTRSQFTHTRSPSQNQFDRQFNIQDEQQYRLGTKSEAVVTNGLDSQFSPMRDYSLPSNPTRDYSAPLYQAINTSQASFKKSAVPQISHDFAKLHNGIAALKSLLNRNVQNAFYTMKYIPAFYLINKGGNIMEGLFNLSSVFSKKQRTFKTQTFCKWKTMIAVKLQMEADVTYAKRVYRKFSKDREGLLDMLNNKENKNALFNSGTQRSEISTTREDHQHYQKYINNNSPFSFQLQPAISFNGGGESSSRRVSPKSSARQTNRNNETPKGQKSSRKKNKQLYQHLKDYFLKELQKDEITSQSDVSYQPPPLQQQKTQKTSSHTKNQQSQPDFKTKYFGQIDNSGSSPRLTPQHNRTQSYQQPRTTTHTKKSNITTPFQESQLLSDEHAIGQINQQQEPYVNGFQAYNNSPLRFEPLMQQYNVKTGNFQGEGSSSKKEFEVASNNNTFHMDNSHINNASNLNHYQNNSNVFTNNNQNNVSIEQFQHKYSPHKLQDFIHSAQDQSIRADDQSSFLDQIPRRDTTSVNAKLSQAPLLKVQEVPVNSQLPQSSANNSFDKSQKEKPYLKLKKFHDYINGQMSQKAGDSSRSNDVSDDMISHRSQSPSPFKNTGEYLKRSMVFEHENSFGNNNNSVFGERQRNGSGTFSPLTGTQALKQELAKLNQDEIYDAMKSVIPNVFESTASNIVGIVKGGNVNPKKEIKSKLYETMIGVLDKAIAMNKSNTNTPNRSLLSQAI